MLSDAHQGLMPLFFQFEAHLWIAYLFLFNGLVASLLISNFSTGFRQLTRNFEAVILSSFFISLLLNGIVLLSFDLLSIRFEGAIFVLPILSVLLISALYFSIKGHSAKLFYFEVSGLRLIVYLFTFTIIFYNGGLIELIADSWWHMSLANKIGYENSFSLSRGHLNGVTSRYYPPLWHGNLALVKAMSDISIPVIWNAFTAWGAVFKVMGFYLLALGLTKDKRIALLSAVLFILLPGMGDSFMRVSAWPSHIAYTAWFCLFYVGFALLDSSPLNSSPIANQDDKYSLMRSYRWLLEQKSIVISFLCLSLLIALSHQAEILWYLIGMLLYGISLVYAGQFSKRSLNDIQPNSRLILTLVMAATVSLVLFSVYQFYPVLSNLVHRPPNYDQIVSFALLLFVLVMVFCLVLNQLCFRKRISRQALVILSISLVAVILVSVDLKHLISLFKPEVAYATQAAHEKPVLAPGFFGGELRLPGWHMQLRSSFLYSGVISVLLGLFLLMANVNRTNLFLFVNSSIPFLFFISPYLYEWLNVLLNYHSWWRIGLLIFSPIIYAVTIYTLLENLKKVRVRA